MTTISSSQNNTITQVVESEVRETQSEVQMAERKPGPISQLATYVRNVSHDASGEPVNPIKIPDVIASGIHEKTRESSKTGKPPFNGAEIGDLVDVLSAETPKWPFLDATSFWLVGRVLIFGECCPAQYEGMYNLYAMLQVFPKKPPEGRRAFKASVGQKIIYPAISQFLRSNGHPLLRRWTGLLVAELLEAPQNYQFMRAILTKKPELLQRVGGIIVEGNDIILKLVAGRVISELVTHGSKDILKKALPDDGFDMPLKEIDAELPIGSGSEWDAEFTQYASKIEIWRQDNGLTLPVGFYALNLKIDGVLLGREGNLICDVHEMLSIRIPGTSDHPPRWVDIGIENIEATITTKAGMNQENQSLSVLTILLKDFLEQGYFFRMDMKPENRIQAVALLLYSDEEPLVREDILKTRDSRRKKLLQQRGINNYATAWDEEKATPAGLWVGMEGEISFTEAELLLSQRREKIEKDIRSPGRCSPESKGDKQKESYHADFEQASVIEEETQFNELFAAQVDDMDLYEISEGATALQKETPKPSEEKIRRTFTQFTKQLDEITPPDLTGKVHAGLGHKTPTPKLTKQSSKPAKPKVATPKEPSMTAAQDMSIGSGDIHGFPSNEETVQTPVKHATSSGKRKTAVKKPPAKKTHGKQPAFKLPVPKKTVAEKASKLPPKPPNPDADIYDLQVSEEEAERPTVQSRAKGKVKTAGKKPVASKQPVTKSKATPAKKTPPPLAKVSGPEGDINDAQTGRAAEGVQKQVKTKGGGANLRKALNTKKKTHPFNARTFTDLEESIARSAEDKSSPLIAQGKRKMAAEQLSASHKKAKIEGAETGTNPEPFTVDTSVGHASKQVESGKKPGKKTIPSKRPAQGDSSDYEPTKPQESSNTRRSARLRNAAPKNLRVSSSSSPSEFENDSSEKGSGGETDPSSSPGLSSAKTSVYKAQGTPNSPQQEREIGPHRKKQKTATTVTNPEALTSKTSQREKNPALIASPEDDHAVVVAPGQSSNQEPLAEPIEDTREILQMSKEPEISEIPQQLQAVQQMDPREEGGTVQEPLGPAEIQEDDSVDSEVLSRGPVVEDGKAEASEVPEKIQPPKEPKLKTPCSVDGKVPTDEKLVQKPQTTTLEKRLPDILPEPLDEKRPSLKVPDIPETRPVPLEEENLTPLAVEVVEEQSKSLPLPQYLETEQDVLVLDERARVLPMAFPKPLETTVHSSSEEGRPVIDSAAPTPPTPTIPPAVDSSYVLSDPDLAEPTESGSFLDGGFTTQTKVYAKRVRVFIVEDGDEDVVFKTHSDGEIRSSPQPKRKRTVDHTGSPLPKTHSSQEAMRKANNTAVKVCQTSALSFRLKKKDEKLQTPDESGESEQSPTPDIPEASSFSRFQEAQEVSADRGISLETAIQIGSSSEASGGYSTSDSELSPLPKGFFTPAKKSNPPSSATHGFTSSASMRTEKFVRFARLPKPSAIENPVAKAEFARKAAEIKTKATSPKRPTIFAANCEVARVQGDYHTPKAKGTGHVGTSGKGSRERPTSVHKMDEKTIKASHSSANTSRDFKSPRGFEGLANPFKSNAFWKGNDKSDTSKPPIKSFARGRGDSKGSDPNTSELESSGSDFDSDDESSDNDSSAGEEKGRWGNLLPQHHQGTLSVLDKITKHWMFYLMSGEDRAHEAIKAYEKHADTAIAHLGNVHTQEYQVFSSNMHVVKTRLAEKCQATRDALQTVAQTHGPGLKAVLERCDRIHDARMIGIQKLRNRRKQGLIC
ncbi:hypothetical protein FN846DRAFT_920624 [Sphaerosporella brunnea]|uniref:Uncharacterized protein n=1 Tax=Sphaerosporella brunnea TaxID=1250544 RepID=A0A5J5ERF6_9PEZI|nr:hypothetical protein FN846DRAFT_920624 [Sphaerosporella brunnea]